MKTSFDIITVGSSLRDIIFYADTGAITHKQVWELQYGGKIASDRVFVEHGGGASNVAVSSSRLGLRTAIISSIGRDEYGASIREHLRKEKVGTALLRESARHTGFSFILVHQKTGEHIAFIHYGAAQECVLPKNINAQESTWTYVSSLNTPDWAKIIQTLYKRDTAMAWNPGSMQLHSSKKELLSILPHIDTLILNEEELQNLNTICGQFEKSIQRRIQAVFSTGVSLVVITRGRKGSLAYDGKQFFSLPKVNTRPIDTTGAGDSYGAGFIAGLMHYGGDVRKAMQLAALNSKKNVSCIGAQNGLLTIDSLPSELAFI